MGAHAPITAPPRREEALAYIIDRIVRTRTSPSYDEIARAMQPPVERSRARQLVNQLVRQGLIEREPGSQRGIRIRDLVACRALIDDALGRSGWHHAWMLGPLEPPAYSTQVQLPTSPPFRHLPDEQ